MTTSVLWRSILTGLKYAAFTGLGALCAYLLTYVLPAVSQNYAIYTFVAGAVIKSIATAVQTWLNNNKIIALSKGRIS